MKQIAIPFREDFEKPMLGGRKICTSRARKYGEAGDIFMAFGAKFVLASISHQKLGDVARLWYREEGFEYMDDFIEVWEKIHYRKRFDPEQMVYVHWFKLTPRPDEAVKCAH